MASPSTSTPGGSTSKPGGSSKNPKRPARRERLERSLRKVDIFEARSTAESLESTFGIERSHLRRRTNELGAISDATNEAHTANAAATLQ